MQIEITLKDGTKQKVEVSAADIISNVGDDKTLFMDLAKHHGIEFEDGRKQPPAKTDTTAGKTDNELNNKDANVDEFKKMIDALNKRLDDSEKARQAEKEAAENAAKSALKKQAEKKFGELAKSGKVAAGQKDEVIANLEAGFDAFSKLYDKLPADPAVQKQNAGGKDEAAGDDDKKKTGGQKVFTRDDIRNMTSEEFKKNETDIFEAEAAGRIFELNSD